MKFAVIVSAIAQSLFALYAAVVLFRGATTPGRRALARTFTLTALYATLIVLPYAAPSVGPPLMVVGLVLGVAALVELLAFGCWYASGAPAIYGPRWAQRGRVVTLLVLFGLGAAGLRDALGGSGVRWELFAVLVIEVATLSASVAAFGVGAKRGVRGSLGFLFACAVLLPPAVLSFGIVAGHPPNDPFYALLRDLAVLLYMVVLLFSYASGAREPISLRARVVSGTLTAVLTLGTVAAQLMPSLPEQEAGAITLRLAAAVIIASAIVIGVGPIVFRGTVLKPIDELTAAFARAEAGERVAIPVERNDELGRAAASFNTMVAALADGRSELQARLDQLETRRREVEELNEELRRQVAERSRTLATVLAQHEPSTGALEPGALIDGRYRIEKRLGGGGMGVVYAALRVRDERRLALKVMTGGTRDDAVRFTREAEIAAKLHHPNLVGVLDVGMHAGAPYLVMERLDGGALADAAGRFGELGFVLPVLAQVAAGLVELHAQGILHRDLKPANVLMTDEAPPTAKIGDFGISRVQTADELAATMTAGGAAFHTAPGVLMGTYSYMAPELARGELGPAVDVFAFGVLAYEALGINAFELPPIFEAIWGRPIPVAAPLAAPIAPELAKVLEATLALDPKARPTATELRQALSGEPGQAARAPHALGASSG